VKAERRRVATALRELRESGETMIDTGTVAAVWAGTMEQGSVIRHLRFRQVKALLIEGRMSGATQRGPGIGPNKDTWIPIVVVENYFKASGVMNPDTPVGSKTRE